MKISRHTALLTVILLMGAFLRFWNLGVPSFWVDEVNVVSVFQSWTSGKGLTLPSGYPYARAPLYTFMAGLAYRITGTGETGTRLPAVIFGILAIFFVYVLGRKAFNRDAGLMGAFLCAFSHFEIGWSRVGKMYTLLQCTSLLMIFLFMKGFEGTWIEGKRRSASDRGSILSAAMVNLRTQGIYFFPCILLLAIAVYAYFYIHSLSVFVLAGMYGYVLFMGIARAAGRGPGRWLNKYTLVSAAGLAAFALAWILFPPIRTKVTEFLYYTPRWALDHSATGNRLILYDFLISPYRFPLACLAVIGGMQVLFRWNRTGILFLVIFSMHLLLLTFVFSHRMPMYIFHVYPLFLLLAAYGLYNIFESESKALKATCTGRPGVAGWIGRNSRIPAGLVLLAVLVSSHWFRISVRIPFKGDGDTNMAVTFAEWREGTSMLKERLNEGDFVLSTVPLLSRYYGVEAFANLNLSLLDQAQYEKFRDSEGKWVDVYLGLRCIESVEDLKKVMEDNEEGWVIGERYHFNSPQYISSEIRETLFGRMGEPLSTGKGTLWIFHWKNPESVH